MKKRDPHWRWFRKLLVDNNVQIASLGFNSTHYHVTIGIMIGNVDTLYFSKEMVRSHDPKPILDFIHVHQIMSS